MSPNYLRQMRENLLSQAVHGPLTLEQVIVTELCFQLAEVEDGLLAHGRDHPGPVEP